MTGTAMSAMRTPDDTGGGITLTDDHGPRRYLVVYLRFRLGNGARVFVLVLPPVQQLGLQRRQVSVHRREDGRDQRVRRPSEEFARRRPERVLRVQVFFAEGHMCMSKARERRFR